MLADRAVHRVTEDIDLIFDLRVNVARYGDRSGTLFVPDLAAALDIKIKALGLPGRHQGDRSRHLDDIAFLVSLIDDPDDFLNDAESTNPCRGSAVDALDDPGHPWLTLGRHAEDGLAVWEILRLA